MKFKFGLILVVSLWSVLLIAQTNNTSLTDAPSEFELNTPPLAASLISIPPFQNPRSMAEWEELQGVILTWDTSFNNGVTSMMVEIVRNTKPECEVIIICANQDEVISTLNEAAIDTDSGIRFIEAPFDKIWIRDYGPNTVYANDVDTLAMVDFVYDRIRPNDDVISEVVAADMNIPLISAADCPGRLVHAGGNYMSDGLGNAFSSRLVVETNGPDSEFTTCPLTESEVDEQMNILLGIDNYIKMEILPFDLIHHVDMHMKVLDEQTLIIGEYPPGKADYAQIEANIQFVLDNFTTDNGDDFEIIRIPMPPEIDGTFPPFSPYKNYTNALFVNNSILVPTYGHELDQVALEIWEEAMPGFNIVDINSNSLIPSVGAVHCITKEVGVDQPLWITTNRVVESCVGGDIDIIATIKHVSGISSAQLYYKTDLAAEYESVEMNVGFVGDDWFATVPNVQEGNFYYYIEATAANGKTITRPIPAPEAYFKTSVVDCTIINNEEVSTINDFVLQKIFPNPANAITCIPVVSAQSVTAEIELLDILGRKVSTIFNGTIPSGESKYFFNARDFTSGNYVVNIKTSLGVRSQKIVIE